MLTNEQTTRNDTQKQLIESHKENELLQKQIDILNQQIIQLRNEMETIKINHLSQIEAVKKGKLQISIIFVEFDID
jgi:hypothetical protein